MLVCGRTRTICMGVCLWASARVYVYLCVHSCVCSVVRACSLVRAFLTSCAKGVARSPLPTSSDAAAATARISQRQQRRQPLNHSPESRPGWAADDGHFRDEQRHRRVGQ